jgi:hypothetical protein
VRHGGIDQDRVRTDVARTTSPGTRSINDVSIVSLLLNDQQCSHWHAGAGSASLGGRGAEKRRHATSCGGEQRRHFTWTGSREMAVGRRNGDGVSKGLRQLAISPRECCGFEFDAGCGFRWAAAYLRRPMRRARLSWDQHIQVANHIVGFVMTDQTRCEVKGKNTNERTKEEKEDVYNVRHRALQVQTGWIRRHCHHR